MVRRNSVDAGIEEKRRQGKGEEREVKGKEGGAGWGNR